MFLNFSFEVSMKLFSLMVYGFVVFTWHFSLSEIWKEGLWKLRWT